MMKKFYLFLVCLFFANYLMAQTTETFETETNGATSFTDNGQVFNITSQAQGPFYIQGNYPNTGWNGTGVDNKYIDNSGNAVFNVPVQFTVSAAGGTQFTLKSMYLFLSNSNLSFSIAGSSCTITGKLAGATVFNATQSSGFTTSFATNNGFTLIDMATYGGSNNATTLIDQYVVTTTGAIAYISLDAMKWQTAAPPCPAVTITPASQTNIACNGGSTGAASVTASGGSGFTYNWSPGNPTGDGTASVTGLPAGTWTVTATNSCGNSNSTTFTITQPSALSSNLTSQTNIACFGGTNGSATVTPSGGSGTYTYVWSPSGGTGTTATGLSAGAYSVLITDGNGCTTTKNVTITQPAAFSASVTAQTNTSCNGGTNGSATVTATGGTGAYTYSWSPAGGTAATATGLSAGTYTVTITDANSCTTTATATISQPAVLAATTSQTNTSCNGGTNGSATVTTTGGTGAYTYSWSPSGGTAATATGLSAGTYTVNITDANNCTTTATATISQPAVLAATTSQTNTSCNGGTNGSATVTTTGGTGTYTYVWSPAGGTAATATGLSAGAYSVLITDANGCTLTKNVTITQPAVLAATTSQTNISCNGGTNGSATVTTTGGTGTYTYVWLPSGGTAATATGLSAGAYSVLITDANGCTLTKNVTITQPAALTATTSQVNATCGPTGQASVTVSGGTGAYTYLWSPSGGTAATATGLTAGTYSVLITDANGCTLTKNFTITATSTLAATTSQVNVSCNGGTNGSATVAVTGGLPSYTYAWSPSGGTAATATGLSAGAYSVLITDANGCTLTKNVTITQPAVLAATTSQTNISCNGGTNGSATVTTTGGTGAYTYVWSPAGGTAATATGLSAGAYSVLITDANGCTLTKNVTITQPAVLAATTSQTNISCNGSSNGSATVTTTGGTGAYTYAWSPSGGTAATATGLSAGAYSVLITDANGCTLTKNVTITQPAALTATTSQVNIACNGGTTGSGTVTVSGGTGAYSYLWSPSGGTAATATGLSAGAYSVLITDANSCTLTKNITITQPAALAVTATKTNVTCNGSSNGTATVNVTGGTGTYTYSWSPSGGTAATATGLAPGVYTALITDANGCTITRNVTITQPAALTATTSQVNITCNGSATGSATVTVTGGTGAYTYAWSPSGGTAATATGLTAGTYSVLVTDANGCTVTQSVTITQTTTITATTTNTNVSCNGGTNGSATITATGGAGTYTYSWSPSGGTAATATGLAAGAYVATITDSNGCSITKNVTITQPAALTATPSQVNISCNGGTNGSATVTTTGGTGIYTYAWSPSGGTAATATGLSAGAYSVLITDANGCTLTKNVTITQPAVLAATTSQTNIFCNGGTNGSATVTVTGGTGTYTYAWSPSGGIATTATGLSAGAYLVLITDANGCTLTKNVTITQPAALTATTSQVNISCNGGTNGSATVIATGGTGTYIYAWSPSGGTAATATGLSAGAYSVLITDANGCTLTKNVTITQPAVLAATTSQTNISCNGGTNGSATVTTTGGTGTYTYSWSPSGGTAATATGLSAGAYLVLITDANGCTLTKNVTITQPAALTATTSQVNISCNGGTNGSATVTTTGGTGIYTYAWSPSGGTAATATGLSAGAYSVLITDANGCTLTKNVTITQPAALTATTSQVNISCNGGANGSATVTATGGTGTYIYAWSPSGGTAATATGLSAGAYSVLITDANGCTLTKNVTITQPAVLAATTSQTNISCNGGTNGSATVTTTGGTETYTYSWSPSGGTAATATGLLAGAYSVLITDANGCTLTKNVTITQPAALTATTSQTNISCNGGTNGYATVTVTGGTGTYTYLWSPSGGTAATATGLSAGAYSVLITDANGCTLTKNVTITEPTALTATTSQINISCNGGSNGSATVTVTGGTGIYTYAWSPSGGTAATATGLSAGAYSVLITDANGCTLTQTVTITEPVALTATTTQINVGCNAGNNGSATVNVSGGTGDYTYSWLPSGGTSATASNLAAGTYTVTVTDANGCIITQSFTITEPQAIVININPTDVDALAGDTVIFAVSSQNVGTYQWQVSMNGVDWDDVTDGGAGPEYSGATTSSLIITGVPVTYDGYLYRVNLANGANCITTSEAALLTVTSVLEAVDDDFSETVINEGQGGIAGDVTLNDIMNGTPVLDNDVTISIIDNGGLTGVTIDENGNITVPATASPGTYMVIYSICDVLVSNNCSQATATIVVQPGLKVDDHNLLTMSIYPNPASTEVFVKIPDVVLLKDVKVTVYDLNGRRVTEQPVTNASQRIDISSLESGVYIFNITSNRGSVSKRIVKDK